MSQNSDILAALPNFLTIDQIKELPTEQLQKKKTKINIIGFIGDHQRPIPTKGTDYKCSVEIKDYSNQYSNYGLKVNFFLPEHLMPRISDIPGDAILIRNATVRRILHF
jgi:protection-of-telomeres protein 1